MKTTILTIGIIILSIFNMDATAQTPIDTLKNGEGKEIYIIKKNKNDIVVKSNFFKGHERYSYKTFTKLFLGEKSINELLNTK